MAKHVITPAWQTQRGPIVQAHGCADGVPVAGVKVYGSTRQNFWPVFDFPDGQAITVTTDEDGIITVNGTGVDALTRRSVNVYVKPGIYYLSGYGIPGVVEITLDGMKGESFVANLNGGITDRIITVPDTVDTIACRIRIKQGDTVENANFRVMLNEGAEAEEWCPPGLTSVSELEVMTAGKNLLPRRGSAVSPSSGLSASVAEDGAISISGTSTGSAWLVFSAAKLVEGVKYTIGCDRGMGKAMAYFQLYNEFGDFVVVGGASHGNSATFTASGTGNYVLCFWTQGAGIEVNGTFRVQLELGDSATAYEPPSVTTTPIDLDGLELRSLPDGTCDVLAVDGSGAVSVEQNTLVLDHTNSWEIYYTYDFGTVFKNTENLGIYHSGSNGAPVMLCNRLKVASKQIASSMGADACTIATSGTVYVFACVSGITTVKDFVQWLEDNDCIFVVKTTTATTTDLPSVTPPTVPAADAALWAASDVPCELEATTWTRAGAEHGRQQAAMAALARQVRGAGRGGGRAGGPSPGRSESMRKLITPPLLWAGF